MRCSEAQRPSRDTCRPTRLVTKGTRTLTQWFSPLPQACLVIDTPTLPFWLLTTSTCGENMPCAASSRVIRSSISRRYSTLKLRSLDKAAIILATPCNCIATKRRVSVARLSQYSPCLHSSASVFTHRMSSRGR